MDRRLIAIACLYAAGLVIANAIASKVIMLGDAVFTVGAVAYPITFILQDVINEKWGKEVARTVVLSAFGCAVLLVVYTTIALAAPGIDKVKSAAFVEVFAPTPRIVVASMFAFLLGGLVDVQTFFAIRKLTGKPHLWLRKVLSTAISQGVDSAVFVAVAFAGVLELDGLIAMATSQYLFKQAIAIGGLGISYPTLRWLG